MSLDNNNVSQGAAVGVTETVQTQQSDELSIQDAVSAITKKASLGRDKIGEALDTAKKGAVSYEGEATIESLAETEGLDGGGHKGIDYNRVIQSLPEDAQKLLSNLRADYTRKTQQLSEERKAIESMRTSLTNTDFTQKIDEVANSEDVQLDPYDDSSFNKRIEQEVARRLQDMMKPIRMEQELSTRRNELEKFKAEHPDLMTMKDDVATLLKSNEALTLQDAYHIAKGRKTGSRLEELERENTLRKDKMREAGLKISTGTRGSDKPPKGLKGYEIYKWLEARKSKR